MRSLLSSDHLEAAHIFQPLLDVHDDRGGQLIEEADVDHEKEDQFTSTLLCQGDRGLLRSLTSLAAACGA
jgi:hypothetical protein